eukprot:358811-Chlamydomonas_euryale.AAC.20
MCGTDAPPVCTLAPRASCLPSAPSSSCLPAPSGSAPPTAPSAPSSSCVPAPSGSAPPTAPSAPSSSCVPAPSGSAPPTASPPHRHLHVCLRLLEVLLPLPHRTEHLLVHCELHVADRTLKLVQRHAVADAAHLLNRQTAPQRRKTG